MAIFSRRPRIPQALRARLDLRGDAVLAAAPLDDGRWAVATRRAFVVVGTDGVRRTAWSDVDRGALDATTRTLTVHWVTGARTALTLAADVDAWDLTQAFRERVQQSVVHVEHVRLPDDGPSVRVVLRRDEHGELFTQVLGDGTVDLHDPAAAARVAAAETRVRAEAGLAP